MTTTRPEPATLPAVELDVVPPARVDRLVVHQTDLGRPSPGGIDSCLRGLLRYAPEGMRIAVVGVDAGSTAGRRLGRWELHRWGDRQAWFLPVTRLDPGDQRRLVPHSARLVAGLARNLHRLPVAELVQAHRADVAAAARLLLRRPLAYFIHNQAAGLTGRTSDSFWRLLGDAHERLEARLVREAHEVAVFNEDYARLLEDLNPATRFFPTWFDPAIVEFRERAADPYRLVWVGRLEPPKDPLLAVLVAARLAERDPRWSLDLVGDGTLRRELEGFVATLPAHVRRRVRLLGRLSPTEVAATLAGAGTFLMTSHPGYEGFPRVLVEAMATGLPALVTDGSDTGGLVISGRNGFVCGRDVDELADAVERALDLDRAAARDSVDRLSAPRLVSRILGAGR